LAASPALAAASERSALVVFVEAVAPAAGGSADAAVEAELSSIPTLSTAIMSATQGSYTTAQMLLDMTQGARVSGSAYGSSMPFLDLLGASPPAGAGAARAGASARASAGASAPPGAQRPAPGGGTPVGGQVHPWAAALRRARSAPQLLAPGLLAAQVPGGGAYVPAMGVEGVDGVLAADRSGHVAAVSLGPSGTLLGIDRLRARHRLVVADLPAGEPGYADLRKLAAARPTGELLVAIERVPDRPDNSAAGQAGHELLWGAFAGLGPGGRTLTSQTTNQSGLFAAIDIAPTILDYLGLPIPAGMRGRPVRTDGSFDGTALRDLKSRLAVIDSRRLPAVAWLVAAWALLLAVARLRFWPAEHRALAAWTMRTGALALLWAPVAALVPAALEPSRTAEFVLLVTICFALGALTDRLVPWPRAPIAPAIAVVLALSVDALAGTQLLIRSLLGPNPAFGVRFYGFGNELKSGLAVLVFTGVAAALYPAVRGRRAATAIACAGILLAIVEGSARIGAGVGAVILVSAGTAVATVMLLPGALNRKRILLVMAAPVAGLVALAAIDLATAHGGGHFTGSVLEAHSAGDIRDIIVRRYSAAYDELKNHLMPVATSLALLASVVAVRRRERLCAPVDCDPAWLAALAGGLTSGAIGALTEDSGPVLLVVAVFTLGCVLSYLWGQPPVTQHSPGTPLATRSRALRRSAAPSG
jgi:hypothetical protein